MPLIMPLKLLKGIRHFKNHQLKEQRDLFASLELVPFGAILLKMLKANCINKLESCTIPRMVVCIRLSMS